METKKMIFFFFFINCIILNKEWKINIDKIKEDILNGNEVLCMIIIIEYNQSIDQMSYYKLLWLKQKTKDVNFMG